MFNPSQDLSDRQMGNCKIASAEMKLPYDFLNEEGFKVFFDVKNRINLYSVFLNTEHSTVRYVTFLIMSPRLQQERVRTRYRWREKERGIDRYIDR